MIMHILFIIKFTKSAISIIQFTIYFSYTAHIMFHLFHRYYTAIGNQQNKNHIFLIYIPFIMYFTRKQQFQHLNKAIYKSITKMSCNIFIM